MSSLVRRPSPYIRFKTILSGPLAASKAFQLGVSLEQILFQSLFNIGPSSGFSAHPQQLALILRRFVYMYIVLIVPGTDWHSFRREVIAFWNWAHPSLPQPQSRSVKRGGGGGGGGQRWYTPQQPWHWYENHRPIGSWPQPRPKEIWLAFMSSLKSLVAYGRAGILYSTSFSGIWRDR